MPSRRVRSHAGAKSRRPEGCRVTTSRRVWGHDIPKGATSACRTCSSAEKDAIHGRQAVVEDSRPACNEKVDARSTVPGGLWIRAGLWRVPDRSRQRDTHPGTLDSPQRTTRCTRAPLGSTLSKCPYLPDARTKGSYSPRHFKSSRHSSFIQTSDYSRPLVAYPEIHVVSSRSPRPFRSP